MSDPLTPLLRSCARAWACVALALALVAPASVAEPETYRSPPDRIARILDAEPLPSVMVSPDGRHMFLLRRQSLPSIGDLAQAMVRLAGRRINPDTNAPHGPRSVVGLTVKSIETGVEADVELPEGVELAVRSWSADGSLLAFTVTDLRGVSLWVLGVEGAQARALTGPIVNALGPGAVFLPDGRSVLVALIPDGRGPAPERSPVPIGPNVQENRGGRPAPVRTFQDLLADAHDEALFEHYFTSQLAIVDVGTGAVTALGEPAIYTSASPSPAGMHLLVSSVEPPYSRLVPMSMFAGRVEVWDRDGRAVHELARTPVADRVPIGGVITGPRGHRWRSTAGTEEVLWVEALDGGDPKQRVEHRDRLMMLGAPFTGQPREVFRTAGRFTGVRWLESSGVALVSDYERDTRWTITTLIDVSPDGAPPREIWSRNSQDRYADPGSPVTTTNAAGRSVVLYRDGAILLTGAGATPEGDRPFIDRFVLADEGDAGALVERLWRNDDESYEYVVDALSPDGSVIITRRETPETPPNYFLRDLTEGTAAPLTDFPHPAPELLGVRKELVRYTRDDGVELSATLYLPPGYAPGERLPLIVWAYPREFSDADTAGQVSGSPYRFTMFGGASHLFLLQEGYAVMDGAAMPVVGSDPDTVNDTFIEQIVASARAAVEKADALGVADPRRVGVGGHSYGAFMTAHLLAHSDLFRAGVARSGAYNRTLTPFGFQAERRTLWEAPEVYFQLSPFMHAHRITRPVLLIHGEIDNNSGTFPMQSERLYHAIKGHGGYARLVMLPHESHGYRARESVFHSLAEMIDWFDEHVKHASLAADDPE